MTHAPAPRPADHEYPLTILEHHLDSFGHVNNATYLALFEEARWDLITKRGYGWNEVQTLKQGPVILEVALRFQKELKLREKICIASWFVSAGKISVMEQQIINAAGEVCAHAQFKFGLFDLKARKLMAPTEAWLRAISPT